MSSSGASQSIYETRRRGNFSNVLRVGIHVIRAPNFDGSGNNATLANPNAKSVVSRRWVKVSSGPGRQRDFWLHRSSFARALQISPLGLTKLPAPGRLWMTQGNRASGDRKRHHAFPVALVLRHIHQRHEPVVILGQPLHVAALVCTTSTQGYNVVHLVAWTCTTEYSGSRAGVLHAAGYPFCPVSWNARIRIGMEGKQRQAEQEATSRGVLSRWSTCSDFPEKGHPGGLQNLRKPCASLLQAFAVEQAAEPDCRVNGLASTLTPCSRLAENGGSGICIFCNTMLTCSRELCNVNDSNGEILLQALGFQAKFKPEKRNFAGRETLIFATYACFGI